MDPVITRHLAWLALRGLAPSHIYTRKRHLIRLAAALPVPLLKATPAMLLDWRAAMTMTPAAVCGHVSHARCFYEWAVKEHLITENPATELPVPRLPRRLPRPMLDADLFDAVGHAPARIRLWLVLTAWTGLRVCEIAWLRAENIRLRDAVPHILVAYDATKGGREHAVPLCPFAVSELAAARLPVTGWAFPRADGKSGPNAPHRVSKLINDYLHGLGLSATAHMGRHRYATELLPWTNLRVVQETLGHASPATTALYTLVRPADGAPAVAHLPVPARFRPAA